ncbi:MAG: RsmD family RNA methyltransferase [Acidimicrobiales bacterium]|nr:RsmD family RNA methyltransferase [Acidimicrobiales bacterium]
MRIVAGSARGRSITVPRGRHVRPSLERVREAVFNALHSLGLVVGASYADLFAGSGALGLEALSRGAASAVFIDNDKRSLAAVRHNLEAFGFDGRSRVLPGDALRLAPTLDPVDVALCDPPYSFDAWSELLEGLPAQVAVIESDRAVDPGSGWAILREKAYGSSVVTIVRRHPPASAGDAT